MNKKILIDSLYINNSGGKVLLEYLLNRISTKREIFFLFDNRLSIQSDLKSSNFHFSKASLFNRFVFYKKNSNKFSLIFSFANIPPLKKYNVPTYTFFHQLKFVSDNFDVTLSERIRLFFQRLVLRVLSRNTDFFIVQSNFMAQQLAIKLNFDINKILVLPFYPPFKINTSEMYKKDKHSFLYVSGGNLHKNHVRLLEAFSSFYRIKGVGVLYITISNPSKKLDALLLKLKNDNIPIYNIGEIPRENLAEFYQKSEYVIYPSHAESFGLGLIEGLEFDCKIIGADLPYTYEVCEPSLVFNPFDIADIEKAFHIATTTDLPRSIKKIDNKIDELLQIFN